MQFPPRKPSIAAKICAAAANDRRPQLKRIHHDAATCSARRRRNVDDGKGLARRRRAGDGQDRQQRAGTGAEWTAKHGHGACNNVMVLDRCLWLPRTCLELLSNCALELGARRHFDANDEILTSWKLFRERKQLHVVRTYLRPTYVLYVR